jgi:hypothetical protein
LPIKKRPSWVVLSAHGPQVVEAEGAASVSERNDVVDLEVLVASADDAGL